MNDSTHQNDRDRAAEALLSLIESFERELRPHGPATRPVSLDMSLDRDLGFDSLSRAELIARIERHFNVALPEQAFTEAQTPRDLLRTTLAAAGRSLAMEPDTEPRMVQDRIEGLPHHATTLHGVLEWHAKRHPERLHARILDGDQPEQPLTYGELFDGATRAAAVLQRAGVGYGDTVAIMLPTGADYFFSFMGVLMCGAIPVPIYPPARRTQLEEHLQRHAGILANCAATTLVTVSEARAAARFLGSRLRHSLDVITIDEFPGATGTPIRPNVNADDTAFLQYTSGSTGNPKGVVLSHANLLANIRAMGEAIRARSDDVFVSWLPLYHDMGLIGAWLGSLYFAIEFVVMSPVSFLVRPYRWLQAIHRYRGTLSASPNFGFESCVSRVPESALDDLDLSSLRLAFNGAEPISPNTLARFTEKFAKAGFRPESMFPVYGLAESSVGLAFPDLDELPVIDCVQRSAFTLSGRALPAARDADTLCFVGCGTPLPGHQIRIVDTNGRELPERREGSLQFRGPSATTGYFHNAEATRELFRDGWLNSGDLAYIADGDVFITGRRKDVIIRGGRNVYPHELEEAVGALDGARNGCVAAFGAADRETGTERLVILAETKLKDAGERERLRTDIVNAANDIAGIPPDEVVLAPAHTVLKTSSGKVRRSACRDLYERGALVGPNLSPRMNLIGLQLRALRPTLSRLADRIIAAAYASYVYGLFGIFGLLAAIGVGLLPTVRQRWALVRRVLRGFAACAGVPLTVEGLEHLPENGKPCILVSNHASYLDAYALIAAIPQPFRFVAKSELTAKPGLGFFLRRLNVEFVERFDRHQSLADSRRLSDLAKHGDRMLFFPEGTFTRMPGLLPFRMGAFTAAVEAGAPVVPIAIRGSRSILRADSWYPRKGRMSIAIGEPIDTATLTAKAGEDRWRASVAVRDAEGAAIPVRCGEPDLYRERAVDAD